MSRRPVEWLRCTAIVARAVWATVYPPVLVRAMGAAIVVGIAAAVLFSPSGMSASDLVRVMRGSVFTRAVLWSAWLLIAGPAVAAAFDAPGTKTLRSLRPPRLPLTGALLALLCAVQGPWALLFARGAGLLAMVGAVLLAVAIGSAAVAAIHRPRYARLALLGAAVVSIDPGPTASAVAGSLLAPWSILGAWKVAFEQRGAAWRIVRPTHPTLALYAAYLLRLSRAGRTRLLVALVATLGAAGGLVLSIRNNPTDHPVQRALAVMTPALFAAAGVSVAPILDDEARLRPWLRSLHVRRSVILAAFFGALATPPSALAASAGIAAHAASADVPVSSAPALLVWAAVSACVVGIWARRHHAMKQSGVGTFAVGVVLLSMAATAFWFTL